MTTYDHFAVFIYLLYWLAAIGTYVISSVSCSYLFIYFYIHAASFLIICFI